jgi:hypothetical protein
LQDCLTAPEVAVMRSEEIGFQNIVSQKT